MRHFATTGTAVALLLVSVTTPPPLAAQTIRGRLVDARSGEPVELGVLTLFTTDGDSVASAVSNEDGRFSVTADDEGSFLLRAWGWGYGERVEGVFDLGDEGRLDIEFRIAPRAMELDELLVPIDRPAADHPLIRNGFVDRYQRGFGHFITPRDLERTVFLDTEALFRFMPGVRVTSSGGPFNAAERVVVRDSHSGWCRPAIYIDGVRTQYRPELGTTLSELAPVGWIEAVEVYTSAAEIPLEYGITGSGTCGVIVFWMKW